MAKPFLRNMERMFAAEDRRWKAYLRSLKKPVSKRRKGG